MDDGELEFMKIFLVTLRHEEWWALQKLGCYRAILNRVLPVPAPLAQKWPTLYDMNDGRARIQVTLKDEACVAFLAAAAETKLYPAGWLRAKLLALIGVNKSSRTRQDSAFVSGRDAPRRGPGRPPNKKEAPLSVPAPELVTPRLPSNPTFNLGESRWPQGITGPVTGRFGGQYAYLIPTNN